MDSSNLRRHAIPLLGKRTLAELTADDIQKFQRDVSDGKTKADEKTRKRGRALVKGGPAAATRATRVVAAMLEWARKRKFRSDNPAKDVKVGKPNRRERFLSAAELARLGEAFSKAEQQGLNQSSLAVLRLLVLTGARKNEVASLKWEHVDFDRAALRLPDSKTGAKIVPLGAPALTLLNRLPRKKDSPWVFPASRGKGHHVGMARIWRKLRTTAKLKGAIIDKLIAANPGQAEAVKAKPQAIGWFVGQVMRETGGKANPAAVNDILKAKLGV